MPETWHSVRSAPPAKTKFETKYTHIISHYNSSYMRNMNHSPHTISHTLNTILNIHTLPYLLLRIGGTNMDNTTSLAWPNMFDVTKTRVAVKEGNESITNRCKLLLLTDPTELYNSPTFGVGLKRYLWQYNTSNTRAIIEERIREQLRLFEPLVNADESIFLDSLLFSSNTVKDDLSKINKLEMTIGLSTKYKQTVNLTLDIDKENKRLYAHKEE